MAQTIVENGHHGRVLWPGTCYTRDLEASSDIFLKSYPFTVRAVTSDHAVRSQRSFVPWLCTAPEDYNAPKNTLIGLH